MDTAGYHLCHLNIGTAKGSLMGPVMAGFASRLDEINNLAYGSPGFVWHLQLDLSLPENLALYGEPGVIFNLSVWESLETLYEFTYKTEHLQLIKGRRAWFEEMKTPSYVLWWMPAGQLPTLAEAKERIQYLTAHGPSPFAFGFKDAYPPPHAVEAAL